MKPSISVIMLTYNRENLLSRAVESVMSQTFADFEFIIVNNGSTDRSGAIADEYAKKDPRVRVVHRSKGNIGSGRNAGLAAAVGKYIAFIDDDDWCEPDFLEFLHDLATKTGAEVAICGAHGRAFDEKLVMSAEEALVKLLWRKQYNVQFPTKLIKSSLFRSHRFSEQAKYDDIELMPKILAAANKVAYHGQPKYTFYRHEGNNSAWTGDHSLLNGVILAEYLSVYRTRTEWLSVVFPTKAALWRYFELSFMLSMAEKIARHGLGDCYALLVDLKAELVANRENFLSCEWVQDFEKAWVEEYVNG